MIKDINVSTLLSEKEITPVIDVRSPLEFAKGHIPGSFNVPLFSNDERAQIGTLYKEEGQEKAIILGESFANPRIPVYLEQAHRLSSNKRIIVYCFRGGLRSQRFSQLLSQNGYTVYRLIGGYKSYRREVQSYFSRKLELKVLSGRTGAGKTEVLEELKKLDQPVIDLEGLASHRGSAFGDIGMNPQPSTEHFENLFHKRLIELGRQQAIWVEDESRNIGSVFLPEDFFSQLRLSPVYFIDVLTETRVKRLCKDYSKTGLEPLKEALDKIRKRLGGERTKEAMIALEAGDLEKTAFLALQYYDKCYDYGIREREEQIVFKMAFTEESPDQIARILLNS